MQRAAGMNLLSVEQEAHTASRGQIQCTHKNEQLRKCAVAQFAGGAETQREAGTREEVTVMEADGMSGMFNKVA